MGSNRFKKWIQRAEKYEEILHKEGVDASGKYLMQFESKLDTLVEALWELQLEKFDEEDERRQEILREKRQEIHLRRLGIKMPIFEGFEE